MRTRGLGRPARVFATRLSMHLIYGVEVTEHAVVVRKQSRADLGIGVGLIAFTPLIGTLMAGQPPPDLAAYRRMQVARWLVIGRHMNSSQFSYDVAGQLVGYGIPLTQLSV